MLLALDVDGVVLDLDAHYGAIARHLYGASLSDPSAWDMRRRYGLSHAETAEVWRRINDTGWQGVPVYDDVGYALGILQDSGCEIVFVSSFKPDYFAGRADDLRRAGFNVDSSNLIACDPSRPKSDYLNGLGRIDWFVDDRAANLRDVAPHADKLVYIDRGYREYGDDGLLSGLLSEGRLSIAGGLLHFCRDILPSAGVEPDVGLSSDGLGM